MKKLFILLTIVFLLSFISAQVQVSEFYSVSCTHCAKVSESGILEKVNSLENVEVKTYDTSEISNYEKFIDFQQKLNLDTKEIGIPFAVIACEDKIGYLMGDVPIIDNLENYVSNCNFNNSETQKQNINLTWLSVIGAAIIDSINPCAFGVLLFLMVSLLNMGSSKRVIKAGIFYSLIVFIVYFLAGLGLFRIIQEITSIRNYIYLAVGIFILLLSLLEFRDYIYAFKGKESILRISPKVKPFIEKYARQGTIIAILILGVVVALFELPCTGGIYLGILSLLAKGNNFGILYLIIYNIIFILPLIILTFLVYYGIKPETLQIWTNTERTWMKLGAAIVMILIAGFLLWGWVF